MVRLVHFFSTVALTLLLAGAATSPEKDSKIHIDHVIVGMNNLDHAVIEFEKQTGVRPVLGGKNPRGRQNALVSLGHGSYLELVEWGPLDKLTPIAWAVSGSDPEVIRAQLSKSGFEVTDSEPGSRLTHSGTTLRWRTFRLKDNFPGAPFFIVWDADSPHPSATSPSGCTLESLNVSSPNVKELVRLTEALNLHIETRSSSKREFTVLLSCPKGKVLLGSTTDHQ
jgi:hypothetical protein